MRPLSSPYGRQGSKFRLAPWVLNQSQNIPHTKWGEVFGGTCALTLCKHPVGWEFLNDKDEWIGNFLSVCQHRKHLAELLRRLRYTAWAKRDFDYCAAVVKGTLAAPMDPVERARVFLVANQQSYDKSHRTHSISEHSSGIPKWKRLSEYIENMALRIRDCHILCHDYRDVLDLDVINDPKTLAYCDPPYWGVERRFYGVNRKDGFDHSEFRRKLDGFSGSVIVSYEDGPVRDLYLPEDGWRIEKRRVTRCLANNGKEAVELLFIRSSDWARGTGALSRRKRMRPLFEDDGEVL